MATDVVPTHPPVQLKPAAEIQSGLSGKLPPKLVTRLSAMFGGQNADLWGLGSHLRRELENAGVRPSEEVLQAILDALLGNLPDVRTAMVPVGEYFGSLEE